jgi:hypothetical protein
VCRQPGGRERTAVLRKAVSLLSAAAIASLSITTATATQYPGPKKRYLSGKKLELCDQGSFFVGGVLKTTNYTSVPPTATPQTVTLGQMYVSFQIPAKYRDYPVIMISGGGHTGACLESTPDGREGWGHYAVRHGIPTFIVDQSGRGRSGFDSTSILEGKAKLTDADPTNDAEGAALIPPMLSFGPSAAYTAWFGHLVDPATGLARVPPPSNILTDMLVPHGNPLDTNVGHDPGVRPQYPLTTISEPIEPDNLVRTGSWGPAPYGPAEAYKLDYYKQIVPNAESTLPGSVCPTCTPQNLIGGFGSGNTWTSRNLAELVENLGKNYGGAIVATHSQSGPIGHHAVRILRDRGKLHYLKGLITVEGVSCSLTAHGLTAADFDNVPYMVLKGDYTGTNASCVDTVNAIKARRAAGQGKAAVELMHLDEAPNAATAWPAPLNRPIMKGITHMMMLGSDEGYGYDSSDIMAVILKWSDKYIRKPSKSFDCDDDDHHHDDDDDRGGRDHR